MGAAGPSRTATAREWAARPPGDVDDLNVIAVRYLPDDRQFGVLPDDAPPFLVIHQQHLYLNLTLCRDIAVSLPIEQGRAVYRVYLGPQEFRGLAAAGQLGALAVGRYAPYPDREERPRFGPLRQLVRAVLLMIVQRRAESRAEQEALGG